MEFPENFIQALLPQTCFVSLQPDQVTNKPDRFGLGTNAFSQPYCCLLWRHDVEPEILVKIDEVAHEFHELRRVTGKLHQPGLDRVLERQLLGQDLGQGSSFNGYCDIGFGVGSNRASD